MELSDNSSIYGRIYPGKFSIAAFSVGTQVQVAAGSHPAKRYSFLPNLTIAKLDGKGTVPILHTIAGQAFLLNT